MKRVLTGIVLAFLLAGCTPNQDTGTQTAASAEDSAPTMLEDSMTDGLRPNDDSSATGLEPDAPPDGENDGSYLRLMDLAAEDWTLADMLLLLETPTNVLEELYDIEPRDIPEDEMDRLLFFMYDNTAEMPFAGINMKIAYQGEEQNALPELLDISVPDGFGAFSDLLQEWGKAEVRVYRNAMGNASEYYPYLSYHIDGLTVEFRSSLPIYSDSEDGPELQERTAARVDRVLIALGDQTELGISYQ